MDPVLKLHLIEMANGLAVAYIAASILLVLAYYRRNGDGSGTSFGVAAAVFVFWPISICIIIKNRGLSLTAKHLWEFAKNPFLDNKK